MAPGFPKMSDEKQHQRGIEDFNSSASSSTILNLETRKKKSSYPSDLVDIDGRAVADMKMDNGEVYVKLKDVKKSGFKLFERKHFQNTRVLDKDEREDIERRVFDFQRKCVLEACRVFTENDIIEMFERAKAKIFQFESQHKAISAHTFSEKTNTPPSDNRQVSATSEKLANAFDKVERPAQESANPEISNVSGTENKQLRRIKLQRGSFKLKVTHLYSNKKIFHGQLLENFNIVEEIMVHVNSKDLLLPVIENPQMDMLVVVEFEKVWYRGVVIQECESPGSAKVELLDYGNKEEIAGNIRQMSEEMQKIPAQAMRFTINKYSTTNVLNLNIDQEIEVVVNKQFENKAATYLVDIKRILGTDEVEKPLVKPAHKLAAKCFMQIPRPSAEIVPGEMIFILNRTDDKLIVKNKKMVGSTKKITSLIQSMQKERVINPEVGQYVLCNSIDHPDDFFRAIIKEINGELASLELIDFFIGETFPLNSLKNLDEALASFPPAYIEINYPLLKKATNEGLTLLGELIREKSKIKSTHHNGLTDFIVDGEILSKKITETKSLVTDNKNKKCRKLLFRDMPFREPEAGQNLYSCFSYHGTSMTIIGLSDENVELIDKVTVDKPGDDEPYKPDPYEMCLVKYHDGSWCRCMAIDDDDGKVVVKFVDYGNIVKVAMEDVRKLPEEMKTIPILGINTLIEGIEMSDAVEKRLKEKIQDGEVLEVYVKDVRKLQNRMNYSVELPGIYNLLKDEGLII